MGFFRSI